MKLNLNLRIGEEQMFNKGTQKYLKSENMRNEQGFSKPHLVVILLLSLFAIIAASTYSPTSSAAADSSVSQPIFLPTIVRGYYGAADEGIAGRISAQGEAAANIKLDLRLLNGSTDEVVDSTTTDEYGYYSFTKADSLGEGEKYYVSFGQNTVNPDYVYFWYGPYIDHFNQGENVFGGSFDIADTPLRTPKSGATEALPITFRWEKRGIPGDSYRLVIIDFEQNIYWRTIDLGDVDNLTIYYLETGMLYNKQYAWYIEVYSSPDSYGESFMIHDIKFLPPTTQQKSISENLFMPGSGRGGR
ncbi:MAG: hypothetical protein ACK2U0_17030 [Candidatus Promineifilaceae bacterium]|jgi:hypothetical protein